MATRQQAERFMGLQPLGVSGLPGEPLQLGLYPPIEPPQQPMTLRQRQQQQLRGLTKRPVATIGQPSAQMTQSEHNQLRKRGNVPPVMAPRQGNAVGSNMVAGVDLNTSSVIGQRWHNDIRNEHARAPRAPITVVNPGARRNARPGQTFSGRSSSIQRSSPGARPLNDFARGFPQ